MKLKTPCPLKQASHGRIRTAHLQLHKEPRAVTLTETESGWVGARGCGWAGESGFHGDMKTFWRRTVMSIYSTNVVNATALDT